MRLLTLFRLPFLAAVLLALAALLAGTWWLGGLALVAVVGIFFLGRDPQRRTPSEPLGVVSPVDGRVNEVGPCRDPFLDRAALGVQLQQWVTSPVVLHSPIEGRVQQIWCGGSLPADAGNTVAAIHICTDEGDDVVFALSRARLLGPLRWTVQPGERVGQGQRRGLAGWGRRVAVYLPPDSRGEVDSPTGVRAATDVIARFVHDR